MLTTDAGLNACGPHLYLPVASRGQCFVKTCCNLSSQGREGARFAKFKSIFFADAALMMLTGGVFAAEAQNRRSEEHKYELKSLMRSSYTVFCLKTKTKQQ